MKVYFYKLAKNYRTLEFNYYKIMKMVEFGLYFYALIIIWGETFFETQERLRKKGLLREK